MTFGVETSRACKPYAQMRKIPWPRLDSVLQFNDLSMIMAIPYQWQRIRDPTERDWQTFDEQATEMLEDHFQGARQQYEDA